MKKLILRKQFLLFIPLYAGLLSLYLPGLEVDNPVRFHLPKDLQARAGEESEEDILARIIAESEKLAKEDAERRQKTEEELAAIMRISAAEENERQEKARQELEAKALADRRAQALQERENKELADALKAIAELEKKEKATQQAAPQYSPEEESLEDINRRIAEFEKAEQQEELKASAPFFAAYEQAVASTNKLPIKIIRPAVIQQKALECGYFAAINGALLYNAFRSSVPNALTQIVLPMLADPNNIEKLLQQAQNLVGCSRQQALEATNIITVLAELFNLQLNHDAYSIYYNQLPDDLTKLDGSNREIVTVLKKLYTQRNFTHIFFLLKAGAHAGQASIGHWIAVVAHNNNNQGVDLYVLDSQYPQDESVSARSHRLNHDKMWQALAVLLYQVGNRAHGA